MTTYNAVTWLLDRNVEEGRGNKLAYTDGTSNLTYGDLQKPSPDDKRAPDGLSKNSVHKVHVAVGAMFDAACSDNLLSANPARQRRAVKAPTAKSKESPGRKGVTTKPVSQKMIRKSSA